VQGRRAQAFIKALIFKVMVDLLVVVRNGSRDIKFGGIIM